MPDSFDLLGPDGPFAQQIPEFKTRPGQREMARRIERALNEEGLLVAESGTGTGKTLAYLVPAILSGRKIIISTGTRNLQDQLFHRDLSAARKILRQSVVVAMLKGRDNYLCQHRLSQAQPGSDPLLRQELAAARDWATMTRSGDRAEAMNIAEDSPAWPMITSTTDNCLGAECPDYGKCFINRARKEAQEADIVVVNHHLFFADLNLRVEGFAQLLPGADAVIFDEAHRLPEIASDYFGMLVSGNQLVELCRDVRNEEAGEQSLVEGLNEAAVVLDKAVRDLRLLFRHENGRYSWQQCTESKHFRDLLEDIDSQLDVLNTLLEKAAPRGEGLANCWRRCDEHRGRLRELQEGQGSDKQIRWVEVTRRSFLLRMTPMDIAAPVRDLLVNSGKALVFTSATLTVDHGFTHYQKQMGLEDADTAVWDSPFDYAKQSLLYLPPTLPDPRDAGFARAFSEVCSQVLRLSRGRAFILFTSYRNMHEVEVLLRDTLPFPLLVQGEMPRNRLLEAFREQNDAVLLGTSSFWEGVDVQGEALSCVIIDKLPFESPSDPVLKARCEAMENRGINPFMNYMVPRAVIALRQGVGRLIRDNNDRGVMVICDRRITATRYGRVFMDSLPPMRRSREIAAVKEFFGEAV